MPLTYFDHNSLHTTKITDFPFSNEDAGGPRHEGQLT